MVFLETKEQRELLKQKLLDKGVVERLFDHIRLGITSKTEGARET